MTLQVEYGIPVGFGVLTCDTMGAGARTRRGATGNKGREAAEAALDAHAAQLERHAGPR